MYRYVGLHWFCKLILSLSLLWATSPSNGHTAVWIGAQNTQATRWVQAGVAEEGGVVFLYEEWTNHGQRNIRVQPWTYALPVTGRLQHRGHWWRAGIHGTWTPWIKFHDAVWCSTLELLNRSHGTGVIGTHVVSG